MERTEGNPGMVVQGHYEMYAAPNRKSNKKSQNITQSCKGKSDTVGQIGETERETNACHDRHSEWSRPALPFNLHHKRTEPVLQRQNCSSELGHTTSAAILDHSA